MTNKPERDRIGEIQDRIRRIETRLTAWMQWSGFETQVQKSVWVSDPAGTIEVPSRDVRLKDVLAAIPDDWCGPILIVHKGAPICRLIELEP